MKRRGFLRLLGLSAATAAGVVAGVVDPEKALWVPGKKTLFVPPVGGWKWPSHKQYVEGILSREPGFDWYMDAEPLSTIRERYAFVDACGKQQEAIAAQDHECWDDDKSWDARAARELGAKMAQRIDEELFRLPVFVDLRMPKDLVTLIQFRNKAALDIVNRSLPRIIYNPAKPELQPMSVGDFGVKDALKDLDGLIATRVAEYKREQEAASTRLLDRESGIAIRFVKDWDVQGAIVDVGA